MHVHRKRHQGQPVWIVSVAACVMIGTFAHATPPSDMAEGKTAPPVTANTSDEETPPAEWPEGATVTGRVVDFQGTPVANAEVILLGEERMIVDIKPLGSQT